MTTKEAVGVLNQYVGVFDQVSARLASVVAFFELVWRGLKEWGFIYLYIFGAGEISSG